MPFTGFSLWPNAAGLLGVNAGNVSVGGRGSHSAASRSLTGATPVGGIVGFRFEFSSASKLTELLSIAVLAVYTTLFRQSRS